MVLVMDKPLLAARDGLEPSLRAAGAFLLQLRTHVVVFPLHPPCILCSIVDSVRGRHDVVDTPVQPHYLPILVSNLRIRALVDEIDENPSFPVYAYVRSLQLPSFRTRIALSEEPRDRYDCLHPLVAGAEGQLRAAQRDCAHIIAHSALLLHRGPSHPLGLLRMLPLQLRPLHIPGLHRFHRHITGTLYESCRKGWTLFLDPLVLDLVEEPLGRAVVGDKTVHRHVEGLRILLPRLHYCGDLLGCKTGEDSY